eukprot:Em0011g175a
MINTNSFSQNLDCSTTSNSGDGVGWTRQAGLYLTGCRQVTNGKRLSLDFGFTNADLGIYTCYDIATNESLNVNITNGSSGQLKVYVSGFPDPTSADIAWFKVGPGENTTELKEPTVNFSSDHRTLLLTNVQDSDGGTYKCIVTQSFPLNLSSSAIMQLAINVPTPVIQQPPNNISLQASSNATLTCIFSGSPNINITWMRADMKLLPPQAQVVTSYNGTTTESTLHIPFIQPSDGGQYRCVATSTRAVVSATAAVMQDPIPTLPPAVQRIAISTKRVVIAFVFVVIGTFLIAMCLSVVIILCLLKRRKTKRHSLSMMQGIRLQSCTSGPTIEDIDPHDDVFTGPSVSNTQPKSFPRDQRGSGSTSSTKSSQPELDPVGPIIGLSPRPWYENSNSSLRQVGIQDDIQPYATTSNLSIPLDPVAERTWGPPPPRPPSPLPGPQVPLPYMDPAPLRQTLERSSRHRSLSPGHEHWGPDYVMWPWIMSCDHGLCHVTMDYVM